MNSRPTYTTVQEEKNTVFGNNKNHKANNTIQYNTKPKRNTKNHKLYVVIATATYI